MIIQYPATRIQFYATSQPSESTSCFPNGYPDSTKEDYVWFSNLMNVVAIERGYQHFAPAEADGVIWKLNNATCDLDTPNSDKCSDGVQMVENCRNVKPKTSNDSDDPTTFWEQSSINFVFVKKDDHNRVVPNLRRYIVYVSMESGDFQLLQDKLEKYGSVYFKYFGQKKASKKVNKVEF